MKQLLAICGKLTSFGTVWVLPAETSLGGRTCRRGEQGSPPHLKEGASVSVAVRHFGEGYARTRASGNWGGDFLRDEVGI